MSTMSQLAAELEQMQDEAWEASLVLEQRLSAISELLWSEGDDVPTFRAPSELITLLSKIQTSLSAPMLEIEGTMR